MWLKATIESVRGLSLLSCPFRGNNESPKSSNHGNIIEMIRFAGRMNEVIGDIFLERGPKNTNILHRLFRKKFYIFLQMEREEKFVKKLEKQNSVF